MSGSTDTTSNTNSSSESINQIPQWVQNAGQANYGLAQQVASQPLQQYQGQTVAGVAPQTQQSWNLGANSGQVGQSAQDAAQAGYLNTLGSAPSNITAAQATPAPATTAAQSGTTQSALAAPTTASQAGLSQLSGTNLSSYMNPYTQSVINASLPIMQQNLGLSQDQQQNAANSANAFGGSRQAIQQGVTQAQGALGMGQMAAQLNAANFAQAQAAGEFDVGQANNMGQFNANQANIVGMNNQGQANNMGQFNAAQANNMGQFNAGQQNQVGLANQQIANQANQWNAGQQNTVAGQNQGAGLSQEQLANAASQGLGNLGGQQMQNNLANFGMLSTAGGQEQQQAQNDINAQIAKFQQAYIYPQQQLGMMESSLGMTPYNTATSGSSASTTNTQQTQSNPLGAATSGMQMLGSLAPFLGGGSDRRLKTDIKKVGKHPSGIDMYSYRYKGDPKTYPKILGPMAEDVMKIAPHAVRAMTTKGHLAVHMPTLDALGAGAAPPSSSGVAKAIGMMSPRLSSNVDKLSPNATPPTQPIGVGRGALAKAPTRRINAPIVGALGG
jgi:Chaperone of endosialidase